MSIDRTPVEDVLLPEPTMASLAEPLLEVDDLHVRFAGRRQVRV